MLPSSPVSLWPLHTRTLLPAQTNHPLTDEGTAQHCHHKSSDPYSSPKTTPAGSPLSAARSTPMMRTSESVFWLSMYNPPLLSRLPPRHQSWTHPPPLARLLHTSPSLQCRWETLRQDSQKHSRFESSSALFFFSYRAANSLLMVSRSICISRYTCVHVLSQDTPLCDLLARP